MSEILLSLIVDYGVGIVFVATFLSCLAVPIPTSLLMLAAGSFAASGDLSLITVVLAAFVGAILGDNTGYWIARKIGTRFEAWLVANATRGKLMSRATGVLNKRGGPAVFLTCWLFAPLGPSMNYVCGLSRFHWPRFALWGMAGEVLWVSIYIGLGYSFANNLTTVGSLLGNISGFLTACVAVFGLGWLLVRSVKKTRQMRDASTT